MKHDFQTALIIFKSKILSQFFEKNDIKDILTMYNEEIMDDNRGEIKLSRSFSESLETMVSLIIKSCENSNWTDWDGVELEDLYKLEKFLNVNSVAIDIEIEGEIIVESHFEEAEDEFQALTYKDQDCELVKWLSNKRECQKKNQHIADYRVNEDENVVTIETFWEKLISPMEYARKHGKVQKFTRTEKSKKPIKRVKDVDWLDVCPSDFNNTSWIKDKVFAHTGYDADVEPIIKGIIEQFGGIIKKHVGYKVDYLIYHREWGIDTVKMANAKKVKSKGHTIQIITDAEFYSMLTSETESKKNNNIRKEL